MLSSYLSPTASHATSIFVVDVSLTMRIENPVVLIDVGVTVYSFEEFPVSTERNIKGLLPKACGNVTETVPLNLEPVAVFTVGTAFTPACILIEEGA
jgi:hypothetical protein